MRIRVIILVVVSLVYSGCEKKALPERPNIVFILADDLGYSDLGCYGSEYIRTPNINRLAENGLRFTNFYNTGRCWPTRTSLMSGFYPHQVLSDNIEGVEYQEISTEPVTDQWLPELLGNLDYRCYHSGKWHLFRRFPQYHAYNHEEVGFDWSYQTQDGRHLRPRELKENGLPAPLPASDSIYEASIDIVNHAIGYLEKHTQDYPDQPFFQYIAFIAPHFPVQALQKDIDEYRDLFLEGWNEIRKKRAYNMQALGFDVDPMHVFEPDRFAPWNLTREELITQIDSNDVGRAIPWDDLTQEQQEFQSLKMAIHAAMVTRMDKEVGRYIDALKEKGCFENTIIFFCSDNGASTEIMNRADKHTKGSLPGSADSYLCLGPGWSTAANTPYRLHKTWVHEGGISTPLVIHWPEGIKAKNKFRDMQAHIIDIAPTLLELGGGSPDSLNTARADAPGISLVPFLRENTVEERTPLFFHHEGKSALRDGNWKITTINRGEEWELYDLENDRGETTDLSASKPEKKQELISKWDEQKNEIINQIK